MKIYDGRFSNGEFVTRRGAREFPFAWRVVYQVLGRPGVMTGFSTSRSLAEATVGRHSAEMSWSRGSRSIFVSGEVVPTCVRGAP